MKTSVLPENYLKCMSAKDRKAIGQKTATEALASGEAKSEKQLQSQIVNLLRLKGIEVLWHRTDKRSAATVGWPDLTFCVIGWLVWRTPISVPADRSPYPFACVWEVKLPTGKLSKEQAELKPKLEANGWRWRCIHSVDEALAELKSMGIE